HQVKHESLFVKLTGIADGAAAAYFVDRPPCGLCWERRVISSPKRRSIVESPRLWARFRPSFSTSIARAMLPLPIKVPTLRNRRAERSPLAAAAIFGYEQRNKRLDSRRQPASDPTAPRLPFFRRCDLVRTLYTPAPGRAYPRVGSRMRRHLDNGRGSLFAA